MMTGREQRIPEKGDEVRSFYMYNKDLTGLRMVLLYALRNAKGE